MTTPTLPSLATPDDIVARLGRNLNQMEAARVNAMLQDGSAIIRRRARESFMMMEDDTISIIADAGIIVLPKVPVISITSVTAMSGMASVPNMLVTWFRFDGIDEILVPEPIMSGVINLPAFWYNAIWTRQSFQVVYTHGYSYVPAEIVGLLCGAIISELATPTMSATIQSESIGAYSYSMRRSYRGTGSGGGGGAMAGMYAALADYGMDSILADYRRPKNTTIATRY